MKTARLVTGFAIAAALVSGAAFRPDAAADPMEYKPKVATKALVNGPLPGTPGKTVTVTHYTFPPGFVTERHSHPGPVYVYVLEGELTIETAKGKETFQPGQLYVETPDLVMRGGNMSASQPLKIVTFQVGDAGKPLMVKEK